MNIIVPDMMQNALTGTMTVKEAADDAAEKIKDLLASAPDPERSNDGSIGKRAGRPPPDYGELTCGGK